MLLFKCYVLFLDIVFWLLYEQYSNQVRQVYYLFSAPVKQYTDDAAMTKCVAESLVSLEKLDPLDLAKR